MKRVGTRLGLESKWYDGVSGEGTAEGEEGRSAVWNILWWWVDKEVFGIVGCIIFDPVCSGFGFQVQDIRKSLEMFCSNISILIIPHFPRL